ncbi:hypothetical protein IGI37_000214 [Enterococcus sp. AZ194]|uniref:sugar transferase n=1 Tax=Enterococcus sp. AZ194 TaxID=2774629 RepID=UPI003F259AC4
MRNLSIHRKRQIDYPKEIGKYRKGDLDTHNLQLSEQMKNKKVYFFVKRVIDLTGASIGVLLLSPIFILISLIIKGSDRQAPVFFSQERVGKNGRIFRMYKFRTMVPNAEDQLQQLLEKNEVKGAMFKIKDDPRITTIGKFLRKKSLDELPQLWNVIKGDMSLVGPRPPLTREVKEYSAYDRQRLLVRPGCSGLWQVSRTEDLDFKEMVQLDLEYIANQHLRDDFIIIFKTFFVMIHSKGAF